MRECLKETMLTSSYILSEDSYLIGYLAYKNALKKIAPYISENDI